MKSFLFLLLALPLLAEPLSKAYLGSTEISTLYSGSTEITLGGGGGAVTIGNTDFTSANVSSFGSSYTFSGVSIGTAGADRIVVAAVSCRGSGPLDSDTNTIGGIAATTVQVVDSGGNPDFSAAIVWAVVPTGTTADVVLNNINLSSDANGWIAATIYTLSGASATATDSGTANNSNTLTDTLTTVADGAVIAVAASNPTGGSAATWTNITEDEDRNVNSDLHTSASETPSGVSLSPQCVVAGGSAEYGVFAAVSFEPL